MNYIYKIKYALFDPFFIAVIKKWEPIFSFLAVEIRHNIDSALFYKKVINDILKQHKKTYSFIGNSYEVEIDSNFTKITDLFAEDENVDVSCAIETEELRKLIILWMTEVKKFSKIKQSSTFKSLDPEYKIYCFLASIYHQFVDNFDMLLDQYLSFETAESRTQLIAAIEQFLQSSESVKTKNEYVQLCADSVHFEELKIAPVAWLAIILRYLKNNKNCSQNAKDTVST